MPVLPLISRGGDLFIFYTCCSKGEFCCVKEMPKIFPIDTIKCFKVDKLSLGVTPRLFTDNPSTISKFKI